MVSPRLAAATEYQFTEYVTYADSTVIEPSLTDRIFYGHLKGFPHNYILDLSVDSEVYIEIYEFDSKTPKPDKNVLVVQMHPKGPVTEITRLNAKETAWQEVKDWMSGEVYDKGSSYAGSLKAGSYTIEVNSPQNYGRYALVVRRSEMTSSFNPFHEYVRVYKLKVFLDKSPLSVLLSPIYYFPLAFLIISLVYMYAHNRFTFTVSRS